jgi:hypothetical protein
VNRGIEDATSIVGTTASAAQNRAGLVARSAQIVNFMGRSRMIQRTGN